MTMLWPLGVVIYCSGTFGESLGANLQRMSIRRELEKPAEEQREIASQGFWRLGFWCFVLSGIFMSFALFFATTTILAPMQLFMFMSNFVFAHYLNHEPFNWRTDGVAATLVAAGVITCVIVAPKTEHNYDEDAMLDLMQTVSFYAFVCLSCGFIFGAIAMKFFFKREATKEDGEFELELLSKPKQNLLNMSYGSLAGALGGVNVTLTKVTFSMMIGQFNDDGIVGVVSSPLLWAVAMFLVLTYISQICVTVDGLEACSAIIVMSTHSVIEEVFATLGGILWFEDYKHFELWSASVFCVGQFTAIAAVVVLSYLRLDIEEEKEKANTPESSPRSADNSEGAQPASPDSDENGDKHLIKNGTGMKKDGVQMNKNPAAQDAVTVTMPAAPPVETELEDKSDVAPASQSIDVSEITIESPRWNRDGDASTQDSPEAKPVDEPTPKSGSPEEMEPLSPKKPGDAVGQNV